MNPSWFLFFVCVWCVRMCVYVCITNLSLAFKEKSTYSVPTLSLENSPNFTLPPPSPEK